MVKSSDKFAKPKMSNMEQKQIDDTDFVKKVVQEVKNKGVFDEFRKDSLADVDTKPAYQNLRNRVESAVKSFLSEQEWTPETNKIQLREKLRKHIADLGFLDAGVECIVDQVVNPKISTVIQPKIEAIAYEYLGMPIPDPATKVPPPKPHIIPPPLPPLSHLNGAGILRVQTSTDLLPTDLEQISPDSDRASLKSDSKDQIKSGDDDLPPGVDDYEMPYDEDVSPPYEPIKGRDSPAVSQETNAIKTEEKIEAQLDTITSTDSRHCVENEKDLNNHGVDNGLSQESQLSQVSSNSILTINSNETTNTLLPSKQSSLTPATVNISEEAQMPKFSENSSEATNGKQESLELHFDIKKDSIKFEGTERQSSIDVIENAKDQSEVPEPNTIEDDIMLELKKNLDDISSSTENDILEEEAINRDDTRTPIADESSFGSFGTADESSLQLKAPVELKVSKVYNEVKGAELQDYIIVPDKQIRKDSVSELTKPVQSDQQLQLSQSQNTAEETKAIGTKSETPSSSRSSSSQDVGKYPDDKPSKSSHHKRHSKDKHHSSAEKHQHRSREQKRSHKRSSSSNSKHDSVSSSQRSSSHKRCKITKSSSSTPSSRSSHSQDSSHKKDEHRSSKRKHRSTDSKENNGKDHKHKSHKRHKSASQDDHYESKSKLKRRKTDDSNEDDNANNGKPSIKAIEKCEQHQSNGNAVEAKNEPNVETPPTVQMAAEDMPGIETSPTVQTSDKKEPISETSAVETAGKNVVILDDILELPGTDFIDLKPDCAQVMRINGRSPLVVEAAGPEKELPKDTKTSTLGDVFLNDDLLGFLNDKNEFEHRLNLIEAIIKNVKDVKAMKSKAIITDQVQINTSQDESEIVNIAPKTTKAKAAQRIKEKNQIGSMSGRLRSKRIRLLKRVHH